MGHFKVWVHIEEEKDGEYMDHGLPDSVGEFDTLEEAEEAAGRISVTDDAPKLLAERDEAVELLREAIGTQISAGFHKSSYAGMIAFIEGLEGEK